MNTSILIAKLIGPVMLAVGIAVLINGRAFRDMADEFLANRALMFISGIACHACRRRNHRHTQCLDCGLARTDHAVRWLTAIGGAIRLIAPQFVVQRGRAMMRQSYMPAVAGAIWAAIGLIFCFFGYR